MMNTLPLLKGFGPTDIVAWQDDQSVDCRHFVGDVVRLAERMPDRAHVFNLCENRYHFLVGFAAALVRGQTNLLPPSQAPQLLKSIAQQYSDVYALVDKDNHPTDFDALRCPESSGPELTSLPIPCFPSTQVAAITFTSGSTGEPKANLKTWASLVTGAGMARARFLSTRPRPAVVVGTVPPQHMYGLEATILLSMQAGFAIHSGRPFYPEDIRIALEHVPPPRILITTPLHIRACVAEHTALPRLEFIVSATAPLSHSLAQQAENMFSTEVLEIYGCTEAGSIASRRTIEGEWWRAYDGMSLYHQNDHCFVQGPQLNEAVELGDLIQLRNAYEFSLHGRTTDLINIAGKRASLNDLNHKLNEIEGVQDGVFFMPDEAPGKITRLMAFVIAPTLSVQEILGELRQYIDAAFLPRPLYKVDSLPRTETGKLPKAHLRHLAAQLEVSGDKAESA
ncbi:MAG: xanthomonadin biosynthesis 3-hydroxybenozate--AMP ligase XanA2 [Gammaproteobacteria bacterium]|nr:MAG: xanthomonadin biosynthesis 3-hydroxybenozate--AMP ligase XanA2 [Gammaproteobacteria bacterium]